MSQEVYNYQGYGIDLGTINPKFSSNVEIQRQCNKIFNEFINDPEDIFEDTFYHDYLNYNVNYTDFDDITIDRHPDSETYDFLMIIENAYVVGEKPIKIYTEDEAKHHLANAFNYIFDKWNRDYTSDHQMQKPFVNQEEADIIKKTIDHEIVNKANYDYYAGPWYNIQ